VLEDDEPEGVEEDAADDRAPDEDEEVGAEE
jgi:hypothetical protein